MANVYTMKLQSPAWDNVAHGYEIQLPVTMDAYQGTSLASILTLMKANNKVFDLRQYREVVTLSGILTVQTASDAGFTNPVQMRDELIRVRASHAKFGKNATATSRSWLDEGIDVENPFAAANWDSGNLNAGSMGDERDASTARAASLCRLVYDSYWEPAAAAYKPLFLYGVVGTVNFGPRPGATTQSRIPYSVQFLVGKIVTGQS